jgi:hypothetical protein
MSDTSDDMEAWASTYEDRFLSEKRKTKTSKMYNLKGIIKFIGSTQQVSDSFKKREFVIEDGSGQYAQTIQFEFAQASCDLLDQFKVGEEVSVDFFLRGREWTNPKDGSVRYFNTLNAWKIGYAGSHAAAIEGAKHEADTWDPNKEDDLPY